MYVRELERVEFVKDDEACFAFIESVGFFPEVGQAADDDVGSFPLLVGHLF